MDDAKTVQKGLTNRDKDKLEEYLTGVREIEQRSKQLESEIEQIENEILRVRKDSEQIENETELLKAKNSRLKSLNASIKRLCFPPACNSTHPRPIEPDCGPSSP
jgi:uncharacterized protein YlxW (UPF0749 family)